jgi:DNA topoisomerase I
MHPRHQGKSYVEGHALHAACSARAAGLRHSTDQSPGIGRKRLRASFRYFRTDGTWVRDRATLARIRALAIPPAWEQVWISPHPDTHLQATGRDARGRKQYRYHPRWREMRDETKYHRMHSFGLAVPRIRRQVQRDLALPGLPRRKALATVVRLLETTFIRVGNAQYARQNNSFGLTTLREDQVRVNGSTLRFHFRGKSGVEHRVALSDRQLAIVARKMRELPGYELFQYVNGHGESRAIESADVNAYLKQLAGDEFTSKDFRTWAGTVLAARELGRMRPAKSASLAKRNVARAVEVVAQRLGNTRAVCRKCYIHPAILESYTAGTLHRAMRSRNDEAAVLRLLEEHRQREGDLAWRSGALGSLAPVLVRSRQLRRWRRSAPRRPQRFQRARAGARS